MLSLRKVFFSVLFCFCSPLFAQEPAPLAGTYRLTEILCEEGSPQAYSGLTPEDLESLALTQSFSSETKISTLTFSLQGLSSEPCHIRTRLIYEIFENQLALAVEEFETSGDCRFLPPSAGQLGVTTIYEIESLGTEVLRLYSPTRGGLSGLDCGQGYRSLEIWTRQD